MDRLSAMKVFVHVVECGGFTPAAEKLELSRAAVSKLVMQLESHLSARLLNRTTRRVSLTEVGKSYYDNARQILQSVEEAECLAGALNVEPRGTIRVNAPLSFGILYMGEPVAEYMNRYPEVEINLNLNDRFVDIIDEGYDVVIRIARLQDSSLIARRIAACRTMICAAPSYLDRAGRPVHPEDLAGHQCIGYKNNASGEEWNLRGPDGNHPVRVRGRLSSNNGDVSRDAAVAGIGIAMLPSFMVGPWLESGALEEVLPEYQLPEIAIYAVYTSNRHVSAKIRTFVDFMAAWFEERSLDYPYNLSLPRKTG